MSKEFEILLERYWELAYLEGKSGVSQGDKANVVLHALKALAEQPAQQEPTGMLHIDRLDKWLGASLKERETRRKPLTKEEFEVLHYKEKGYVNTGLMDVVRIVEHHHNIKENT